MLVAFVAAGIGTEGARAQSAAGPKVSKLSPSERTQILAYVSERLAVEVRARDRLQFLQDEYPNVDIDRPYSVDELASSKAIESARLRVSNATEMNAQYRSIIRDRWHGFDRAARSAELPVGIRREVLACNRKTYASVLTSVEKWEAADRAFHNGCLELFTLAKANLPTEPKEPGQIGFATPALESQVRELQSRIQKADEERIEWHGAVIDADDGINEVLRYALSH